MEENTRPITMEDGMNFETLVQRFAEDSIAKQDRLAEAVGDHEWSFEEDLGLLEFNDVDGETLGFSAQLLGIEATDGRFRWAWDDPATPPSITRVARQLKSYGEKQRLPVLTEPEFLPSDFGTTSNAIATVASGLHEAIFYYRAPYDDGALYLLVLPDEDEDEDGE
jgi:hypothetical protein